MAFDSFFSVFAAGYELGYCLCKRRGGICHWILFASVGILMEAVYREDRAPRGSLVRSLETSLGKRQAA